MAREAFQSETVSEHIDNVEFETKIDSNELKAADGVEPRTIIDVDVLSSFWSLEKCSLVIILTSIVIFGLRNTYCAAESLLDDTPSNAY